MEEQKSVLDAPAAVKADVLRLRGWREGSSGQLWCEGESGGIYHTLDDAYKIQVNRNRLQREPQAPSPASAGYPYAEEGYLGERNVEAEKPKTGIEKAFVEWTRAIKNAEAARREMAETTRALNAYRAAVNSPVVLSVEGTLYVLEFGADNGIEFEEAVSAEQAQQAFEDIPF